MEPVLPLPVRTIGGEVDYSDTSEERILEILKKVSDASDGSDELAGYINDWPTRYHCSAQRSNLLKPFTFPPGTRVLEIGAGTGVLTQYLAECGTVITAIEGTRKRADAAALRCRHMESVEIICGDFKHFVLEKPFDIVLVVGVLEYAAAGAGGRSAPSSFLKKAVSCLNPHGVLILAIENQLGLKYLLGGKEDHLGKAWIGLEGYPGEHGVQTWGRHTLGTLLKENGLPTQRWFFPFPDYKTPAAILSESAYATAEAPRLIDQWASPPIIDYADPNRPIHDDRAIHRIFLGEGLGPDVANSFLIAATQDQKNLKGLIDGDTLIWHFGGDRRRARRRVTTLERRGDELWVQSTAAVPDRNTSDSTWLEFRPDRDQPYIEGPNLEQEILDACRRGSSEDVEVILDLWWNHLRGLEKPLTQTPTKTHPFLSTSTTLTLEPDYLDVQPSNFIRTGKGLEFIDREWSAPPLVDAEFVRFRALWYLARTLFVSGAPLPWPEETTVESLVEQWMVRWTTAPNAQDFSAFYRAETALQLEVSGGTTENIERALAVHGQLSRRAVLGGQTLAHSLSPEEMVTALQGAMQKAGHHQQSLEQQISNQRRRAEQAERHLQSLEEVLNEAKAHTLNLEAEITDQHNRADLAEEHLQSLEEMLSEAKTHTLNLEAEIDNQRNRANLAEHHFQAAQKTISDLNRESLRASGHIENLEKGLAEAKDYSRNLEKSVTEQGNYIGDLEASLNSTRNTVAGLQKTIETKDLSITDLELDLETTRITLEQTRSRLAEAEAWRREFENRPLIRLYRRLRWWLPQ
jgi:2-polyprenyl-3-methyl-5-hydroxy-6-metoxy-1,4-benzoquinol methylase/predicted  nucleic acid-binding Zn-ribbon protein